jgi:hypothetical protein
MKAKNRCAGVMIKRGEQKRRRKEEKERGGAKRRGEEVGYQILH